MPIGVKSTGGKASNGEGVLRIGVKPPTDPEPSGEAITQDRATQFGYGNKSSQTTGNANYKSPGSAGGMT
jgi:hypothetical protein